MIDTVSPPFAEWLAARLDDPGPFTLTPLSGGNSNETLLLRSPQGDRVVRRPPASAIDGSAHSMAREFRILTALRDTPAPAPAPLGLCEDLEIVRGSTLVMEAVDGVALTDTLPGSYPEPAAAATAIGEAVIDALAALHDVDWRAAGLTDFGRPEGFLERQVGRWTAQLDRYRVRPLPDHEELAVWLEANRPQDAEPAILHGDFHIDNCLLTPAPPVSVAAIIDWEMATIGDPLLDLGIFLAFWGTDRPAQPAMPRVQGVSRVPGSPSRQALADRYAQRSGRSVQDIGWYMALAFWKLATIVEGAYAQHLDGKLDTPYARALEQDVPTLLAEAKGFAGLAG